MNLVLLVLNYNDSETTIKFLKNIKKYETIGKIVVVDNKSVDNSYEQLKKLECENIDVITTEKNQGYGTGNNFGIKYAIEKYNPKHIIISNPDVEFKEEIICKMINDISEDNNIAIVSGMVIENDKYGKSAWKLPSFMEVILSNTILLNKFFATKMSEYNSIKPNIGNISVEVVPGCFFMMKTNIVKKVGFFDNDTFLYYEENILSRKLLECGYEVILDTDISFKHQHGKSINKSITNKLKKYKILQESKRVYIEKCLNTKKLKLLVYNITSCIGYIERAIVYTLLKR